MYLLSLGVKWLIMCSCSTVFPFIQAAHSTTCPRRTSVTSRRKFDPSIVNFITRASARDPTRASKHWALKSIDHERHICPDPSYVTTTVKTQPLKTYPRKHIQEQVSTGHWNLSTMTDRDAESGDPSDVSATWKIQPLKTYPSPKPDLSEITAYWTTQDLKSWKEGFWILESWE